MHAFDFVVLFFSFVYAAAVAHVLATTGEIVIAAKRIKISWLNAGWMLASLFLTCSWWIGFWDLHEIKVWPIGLVGIFFFIASAIYVLTRMVCPRIPHDGNLDIVAFHQEEGRKYTAAYAAVAAITVIINTAFASLGGEWLAQNLAVIPMVIAAVLAALFVRTTWVQFVAIGVELLSWGAYFVFLQKPIAG
jgi:hypothetical protein